MLRLMGVFFAVLLIAAVFFISDQLIFRCAFIEHFVKDLSIQIMGTILAMNIAIVGLVIGQFMSIELKHQKILFSNTRREIKHNVYWMIGAFLCNLLLQTALPEKNISHWHTVITWVCFILFMSYIVALVDIFVAVLNINKFLSKNES